MPKIELTENNLKIQENTIKHLIKNSEYKDFYIEELRKIADTLRAELQGMTIIAFILLFSFIWCLYKLSN